MIFLAVLVLIYGFMALVGGLLYLIYFPFKKYFLKSGKLTLTRSLQINKIYIYFLVLIPVVPIIFIYLGFYPNDEFYAEEFKRNTTIDLPISADITKKIATYPDHHGSYSSGAIIKLEKVDYLKLKNDMSKLKEFKEDTLKNYLAWRDSFVRQIKSKEVEVIYTIGWFRVVFLKDKTTIIFERHSS